MPTTTMTSRDRVHSFLERRDQDRIPRHDGYWPETIRRWQGEGLDGDNATVLGMLRSDFQGVCWTWPVPFPGRREVVEEDEQTQLVIDNMGKTQRIWRDKSGTPEHVAFDCDSSGTWRGVYKPALLEAGLSVKPDAAKQSFVAAAAGEKFVPLQGIEPFEAMRQLVGDEVLLVAFADEPEWVDDMAATYNALILRDLAAVVDAGVDADAVWVFGDIGYNRGPFVGPAMYREVLWKYHKALADWAHTRGMKFIYHTDGDVRPLLPHFLDAGFDCIQPMEAKAGMDVRELSPMYGDRLSFFGNIDMTVAGTNDREKIEHEVRSKLDAGMSRRGYAYYSDHSVHPGVSWTTYRFIIDLLDRYGNYA